MKEDNLNKKEILWLALLILLGCVSFFAALFGSAHVFAETHIDLKINAREAEQKSESFLRQNGINPLVYQKATLFWVDETAKTYLEKNLPTQKAGRIMNEEIHVWGFKTRFFIPEQTVEYQVYLDHQGQLIGYKKIGTSKSQNQNLTEEQALKRALDFIKTQTRHSPNSLRLVNKSQQSVKNQKKYSFEWHIKEHQILDAPYLLKISLSGNEIVQYNQYLQPPEQWIREQKTQFNNNETAQLVAEFLYILLILIPLFIILIIKYRKGLLHYRFTFAISLSAAVVIALVSINSFSLNYFRYSSSLSWSFFLASLFLTYFLKIVFTSFSLWITLLAGEALYRGVYPQKISLRQVFQKSFLRQKNVLFALSAGFGFGALIFIYQMLYYSLGQKLGYWIPLEIDYANIFNTPAPWIFALLMAFIPALTEEVTFRLFGIPLFKKITGQTWAAVVIPSVLWAFLHSAYPQEPYFARGLELIPVGILFSWLFLKFGLLASVTAHFTLNSLISTLFLLNHNHPLTRMGSVLIFLIPLILIFTILILLLFKNKFVHQTPIRNKDIETQLKNRPLNFTLIKKNSKTYTPLSNRQKNALYAFIALTLIGIPCFSLFFLKSPSSSHSVKAAPIHVNRYEIKKIANQKLAKTGKDPKNYYQSIKLIPYFKEETADFLLDTSNLELINQLYENQIPAFLWKVRYFQPLQKESRDYYFRTDGRLYTQTHTLDESHPGPKINHKKAKIQAENYLRNQKKLDLSQWELIRSQEKTLPNRTDHFFVYKNKEITWKNGFLETSIHLYGNEINHVFQNFHVPEYWRQKKAKQNIKDFIIISLTLLFVMVLMGISALTFLQFHREKKIKWGKNAKGNTGAVIGATSPKELQELTSFFAEISNFL